MSAVPLIDARPLQPGYKQHAQRGIGRYAKNLLSAMLKQTGPEGMELLVRGDLPDAPLAPAAPRLGVGPGPTWLPGGERLVGQHHTLARALAPALQGGRVVHILSHGDAPACPGPGTVITCHDLIYQRMEPIYTAGKSKALFRAARWLETRCLSRAARIIAVSQCTARDLGELYGVPPERIRVIPEAADPGLAPVGDPAILAEVLGRHGLSQGGYVFYLGGIDPRKDLPTLLKALLRLQQAGSPLVLALAGPVREDKHYPALAASLSDLRLGDAVKLLGFVPEADLPALYSGAAAFAFPSRYEGFGLPPLEAMACGAPVAAARAAAVPEVVGEAGLMFEPGDDRALAEALAALAMDHELAAGYRAKGLQRAREFSWDRAARDTLALYEEVRAAS
ncbi:MAG: glycosyltransferase family 4 protein [Desulfarculaceae bacterium]|nr:glycosyltransferase family 4 protein [Desulfarculaceae bacterium]MCF8071403.1 glycosyltransferase family 4 protein [Desulfarculaceae bacterium]MCF8101728.1 glycosyltransferase family 4 protein [Desulfarculaceae bacterium]MCF8117991.1 glycosyltransferase family 4 protein [Desulfarculaceae bacterium]